MVHVGAAHGLEAGDYCAGGTLDLGGPAFGMWPENRLGHLVAGIVASLGNFPDVAAFADGFVDGSACSAAQAAERATFGAVSIMNLMAAGAAGSFGHSFFVSERTIRTQASAIEPCLVEVLAGLHVKANRYGSRLTQRIGGRTSAVAAAEIAREAFVRYTDAIAVESPIAVVIAVMITVLGSRERDDRDEKKNREYDRNSKRPAMNLCLGDRNRLPLM